MYCVHSLLFHSPHMDSTYALIFSQSTETILSEIINIFLDAQSNGDLETSSHVIDFSLVIDTPSFLKHNFPDSVFPRLFQTSLSIPH